MPAWTATADTVEGLSPEMTFTVTPCWAKYWKVLGASSRMGLAITARASGSTPPAMPLSMVGALAHLASSSTRQPRS